MSETPGAIPRKPPADPGLNYVDLVAEGTHLVQRLSGAVWTDYNYSDPGVTILEQLCYALTELSFRADLSVPDLLGAPGSGEVLLPRQGLHSARTIMPVNPVTQDDLRRLVIDRVPEVGNAWFTPIDPTATHGVNGLYALTLLVPSVDPCCEDDGPDPEEVRRRALKVYGAHRALCEDVAYALVLRPLTVEVRADVQIDNHRDPNTVLAEVIFNLGLALAPEPRRRSLDAEKAAGKTTAEIFDGPLMLRGFIDDDQLTAFRRQIHVEDLQAVMAETSGVLSVDRLEVRLEGGDQTFGVDDTIEVPEGRVLWLDTRPHGHRFGIRLLHGGMVCRPDPPRVRRRLDRAWAMQRRTYPLWSDYARDYGIPTGQGEPLATYSSVQEQFPAVYGIGHYGLPSDATAWRRGAAKQLKGYLMVYDQLMADYFSQLAFIRDLFSLGTGGDKTYVSQSLRHIAPHSEDLFFPHYDTHLKRMVAQNDPVLERQMVILDFLLSLYAETLTTPVNSGCGGASDATPGQALLKAKRRLLSRIVPATRDRGRGFDYHARDAHDAEGRGLDIRCRIELTLLDARDDPDAPQAVHPAQADFGRRLSGEDAAVVEAHFLPVELTRPDPDDEDEFSDPLAGRRVAATLLKALGDPWRYRLGVLPGEERLLLCAQATDGAWWRLMSCRDAAEAVALTNALVTAAAGEAPRLRLVEWTLLRFAREHAPLDGLEDETDPFSFRISAVLPTRNEDDDDDPDGPDTRDWRREARSIIRENLPSHIVVDDIFLDRRRMRRFRRLHEAWVSALRDGGEARRAEASWRLAQFLSFRTAPPERSPTPVRSAPFQSAPVQPPPVSPAPDPPTPTPPEPSPEPPPAPSPDPPPAPPAPPALATTLPGTVVAAPVGAKGFDTDTQLSAADAQAFAGQFSFAIRYLSNGAEEASGDLTHHEALGILQAGLALMAVQHSPAPGWTPDAALGTQDGQYAVANAAAVGLPPGVTLWLDLEGVAAGVAASEVAAYGNAWYAVVAAARYVPGLYVGAAAGLDGDQLYDDLSFTQYWRSGSNVPEVAVRGYCLVQTIGDASIDGVPYDSDLVRADADHGTPYWLAPRPPRPDLGAAP